jgi:hypothetical protein
MRGSFRGTEKSEKGVEKEAGKVNSYQCILKECLLYYQMLFARLFLYQLAIRMGVGMSSPDVNTVVHQLEMSNEGYKQWCSFVLLSCNMYGWGLIPLPGALSPTENLFQGKERVNIGELIPVTYRGRT